MNVNFFLLILISIYITYIECDIKFIFVPINYGNKSSEAALALHMFVMLKPHTALNILHTSLNDFGYPCKKLLTKQMIPMLNKINSDGKSSDFKKVLKSNYEEYHRNSPEASKYKGWFTRIKRL